ncbi:MAG TPA: hypothetical protein VEV15_10490 [Flavisolibacter sp.]|nr:hypothetical protein [Flavisolibacter sp.]
MRPLIVIAATILFFSCSNETNKPEVSDIKVDFKIERFEQSFFKMDTSNIPAGIQQVNQQFPNFFPFYVQQILRVPPAEATPVIKQILTSYAPINDSIQKKYSNLNWLKDELTTSFKYVKYYYPSYKLPDVITFIGTFDAPGVVLTPHYLGIGLHQYAGKNFSVYKDQQLQEMYPDYISRRFDKEYMGVNSMKAIVDDIYPDSSTGKPLIEQMIEKGKQWYLLDKFLPDTPDSLKTGYTKRQLDWVKNNEGNIWGFFTSNTDIYTIDPAIIQDYIGEGPFTRGMPEGASPGNIGQWVGWQIVKKFAEKKPELTVQQVLATPAKTIFGEAKYKPK